MNSGEINHGTPPIMISSSCSLLLFIAVCLQLTFSYCCLLVVIKILGVKGKATFVAYTCTMNYMPNIASSQHQQQLLFTLVQDYIYIKHEKELE